MRERPAEDLLWRPSPLVEIARYALAFVVVAVLAVAATLAVLRVQTDGRVASDADEAVMIDLPPAIDSSAPPRDVNEGPEQQAERAATPAPAAPAEVAAAPTPPAPNPPDAKPEQPEKPVDQKIEAPPAPRPEAAATPAPKPVETPPPEKPPEDRAPDPVKTEVETPAPPPVAAAIAREEMGISGSAAREEETEAIDSQASRARSAVAITRWQRSMLARLVAAKRGMRTDGEIGAVEVLFSIDDTGAVVSSRVSRGSGSLRLDQAALALVRRASPFPMPPAGLTKKELTFKVPVIFARRP